MAKAGTTASIILTILGLALVGVGVALVFVFPGIIKSKLEKAIALRPDSASYDTWVTPPAPLFLHLHFFHVVNPDEIIKNGAKPQVKEVGPYTYREVEKKQNITFSDKDQFVTYQEPKVYVFEPTMSVGPETDNFTLINFPILTFANMLKDYNLLLRYGARGALTAAKEKLFTNYTVHEYMFGFKDPLIAELNSLITKIGIKPIEDTFGLFYGPTGNGTSDGLYEIHTGVGDIKKMSLIENWKGNSSLDYWNSSYCNMINGSDGHSWHPYVEKSETLYLFSSDICRSLYVTYEEEKTIEGVHMYRFTVPPEVLANHTTNPDNRCYCTEARGCLGAGVVDIGKCKQGAPLILSLPHFYQGDQKYVDAISGLNPNKEKHETIIDVEPYTGNVMHAAKKLQFNMYIEKLDAWEQTDSFKEPIIFPVLWLNESGALSQENAKEFSDEVLWPMQVTYIVQYSLMGLGGLFFLGVFIFFVVRMTRREKRGGPLLIQEDEDDSRGILDPSRVSS